MNYVNVIGDSINSDKRLNVSPTDIFSSLITGLSFHRAYPTLVQIRDKAWISAVDPQGFEHGAGRQLRLLLIFFVSLFCISGLIVACRGWYQTMLDFMDYITLSFAEATHWNRDNSYSSLTTTAECM